MEVVLCRVYGKGLKEGLFEVYKDSSIIQVIGQLLEHKYCQLYVKHITGPKANVENPKADTEGGAEGTFERTDLAAEESEENSSGSESDFGYGDVPANLSEEDDPELQDIRSQVLIAKKNRAKKLKSVRLEKDLDTQKNKGKEKEGAIVITDI
ncbi:hypothetical protein CRG98_043126 [Punica granatum]|uniref:Uncharacterized protein n=1 Tax=Punica granatum TaxID=22663 RepID=A0A2I0HXS9_PUNGR|nr:hypothetical protein CRG98_043126 [Punica granatum]